MHPLERYTGSLLGLASGDAVGTAVEFKRPGSFKPIDDMVGGGQFRLRPGEWTDDTSMALCLAESLIERKGFDPLDQLARYVRWWRSGYLSSNGRCFDIGSTVAEALARFERTNEPYCGGTGIWRAGNGSIMRLAPVPLFFAAQPFEAIERSGDSSRTTHAADACVDACRYLGSLIVGAVTGASKVELLSDRYSPVTDFWTHRPLVEEIDKIACGSYKYRNPPEIAGKGYVVKSLEAALWAFYNSQTFEQGCLLAANLGDDADTTAAVYGQLAGAYYGESAIPQTWLSKLAQRDRITSYAQKLYELSGMNLQVTR